MFVDLGQELIRPSARFPAYKDMAGFDFASSDVNEALFRQLHTGTFIDDAHNIVLIGGPGTGKTNIAAALAVQAVTHHLKKKRASSLLSIWSMLSNRKKPRTK